jgi:dienelactone hydrolase
MGERSKGDAPDRHVSGDGGGDKGRADARGDHGRGREHARRRFFDGRPAYDAAAAEDAWRRVLAPLAEALA